MDDSGIIERVAAAHSLDVQVVEDLVNYFWLLVMRCFNDNRMPSIKLPGLGLFHVKPTKLRRLLNGMESKDYRYRDKPKYQEDLTRIRGIYYRRLIEEYSRFEDRYIPVTLREDVQKLRQNGWSITNG